MLVSIYTKRIMCSYPQAVIEQTGNCGKIGGSYIILANLVQKLAILTPCTLPQCFCKVEYIASWCHNV